MQEEEEYVTIEKLPYLSLKTSLWGSYCCSLLVGKNQSLEDKNLFKVTQPWSDKTGIQIQPCLIISALSPWGGYNWDIPVCVCLHLSLCVYAYVCKMLANFALGRRLLRTFCKAEPPIHITHMGTDVIKAQSNWIQFAMVNWLNDW